MQFRLITYNIHKGIGGVDRRYQLQRVIDTLDHYDPDIVLLQEVDDGVPRSKGDRQVDLIADGIGLRHRTFQENVKVQKGHYGNAILSRFPMHDIRHFDLKVPLKKRRRALAAHCRIVLGEHSRTLLLVNFHLGLAGFERTIQLRRIIESDLLRHVHHDTATIVAGDYNDVWGTLGKRMLEPEGFRSCTRNTKTFPAVYPLRPLDRIYFRGRLALDHSFASRLPLARQASDHLPLVADFEINR